MKHLKITVNGVAYDVQVEEADGSAPAAAPAAAPAPKAAPAPQKAAPAGGAGDPINSPMPGTIVNVPVKAGQAVKKGDAVVIIEAMKMEIPVVAPSDGTIASIDVTVGDSVEAGACLATMN